MKSYKQFKDPIYGYIKIDSGIVSDIIDTPTFQRLKNIRQTSFAPLFPSAHHNRYVHSLGVYYLGCIAFDTIRPQLEEIIKSRSLTLDVDSIQTIFELACLLHDVGHAPFSHTGEDFFLDKSNTLYNQLKDCVDDSNFSADFDALGATKPAAHECMSCVVALNAFPKYFETSKERSLFARCIIGMEITQSGKPPEYSKTMTSEERRSAKAKYQEFIVCKAEAELLNCVISLLNSSIIDVDRLDYIIRDASTIGFENVQVDYMRLLGGIRIVERNVEQKKRLCIGYHKSAISIIESAVYAHDSERKWIQGHPSILYEMEVLKSAMSSLNSIFANNSNPNPLFCYEALTEEGTCLSFSVPFLSPAANDLQMQKKLWTPIAQELLARSNLFKNDCRFDVENGQLVLDCPISLLADEDILYLMKQFCKNGLGHEYFARDKRRLPLWKSEAEFRALFQENIGDTSKAIQTLEADLKRLADYCQTKTGSPIACNDIFEILDKEEADANSAKENEEMHDDMYKDIIGGVLEKRYWLNVLCNLAIELNIDFDFLIVFQKKFNSSFKAGIGEIPILFPNVVNDVVSLGSVVDVLKSSSDKKSNFFHLFYKPNGSMNAEQKKAIVHRIAIALISAANFRLSH